MSYQWELKHWYDIVAAKCSGKKVTLVVQPLAAPIADISHYIHEKLDEPDLVEDEDCYCFSAPLDTCPEHGLMVKWRREHEG